MTHGSPDHDSCGHNAAGSPVRNSYRAHGAQPPTRTHCPGPGPRRPGGHAGALAVHAGWPRRGQAPAQVWSRCAPDTQLHDTKPSTNHAQQYRPMLRPLGARRDSDQTHANHICAAPARASVPALHSSAGRGRLPCHFITITTVTKSHRTSPAHLEAARHRLIPPVKHCA